MVGLGVCNRPLEIAISIAREASPGEAEPTQHPHSYHFQSLQHVHLPGWGGQLGSTPIDRARRVV